MRRLHPISSLLICSIASKCANAQVIVNAQLPLQASIVPAANQSVGCYQACIALQDALGQNQYFNTPIAELTAPYFSVQQQELVPQCKIQPASPQEVSQAVGILTEYDCFFAVRSGGHCTYPGASSISNGVVIDLAKLNGVQVSDDESTVSVGSGNVWSNVYPVLEERGLLAVGGRVGSVGVGGFTLGGGISFLSRRHGWALDNVQNFEVVLANGTIVNVSKTTHPDLYFALRGGGNNFGIVTRFDLDAYRYGLLWGGTNVMVLEDLEERRSALGLQNKFQWTFHSIAIQLARTVQLVACRFGFCTKSMDLINVFVGMSNDEQTDPSAHMYVFLSWVPVQRAYMSGATILYGQPEVNPPVFQNFTSIQTIQTTNRLANMSDFTQEVEEQSPVGLRQLWRTATFKVNASLISKLWDIFLSEVDLIRTISGTLASCNLQLLTKSEIEIFSKDGGNSLGINKEDGPLFFFSLTFMYENARDDEIMKQTADRVMARSIALGQELGMWHRFIYQNYAGPGQDAFAGYGQENRARLLDIQHKYDPTGVFQRLQPGYFKL